MVHFLNKGREEEDDTLGKIFTERKRVRSGRIADDGATCRDEERERIREEEERPLWPNRYKG
jgi:hypothetical protein